MNDFIELIYGIKGKSITARNPQANAIVERAHEIVGDILCIFKIGTAKLDPDYPWGSILSAVMFALKSTIHTTHKATSMQFVFRRDAILNVMHLANWWYIQKNQQKIISKNNKQENVKWKLHEYQVNNKVMIKNGQKLKYGINMYSGLYQITRFHNNRTVHIILNHG
eukprot:13923080-Ditylum_brightwellii.AAC.1